MLIPPKRMPKIRKLPKKQTRQKYERTEGAKNESDLKEPGSSGRSGSFNISLAMWDLGQCDRKRCTGTRLVQKGVVKLLYLGARYPGLVLTPAAEKCVSVEDRELLLSKGDVLMIPEPCILPSSVPSLSLDYDRIFQELDPLFKKKLF